MSLDDKKFSFDGINYYNILAYEKIITTSGEETEYKLFDYPKFYPEPQPSLISSGNDLKKLIEESIDMIRRPFEVLSRTTYGSTRYIANSDNPIEDKLERPLNEKEWSILKDYLKNV